MGYSPWGHEESDTTEVTELALRVGFPGGSDDKESACNARDSGLIPGSERFPGEGVATHSIILT